MIALKYNKCGAMAFISHIDLVRHFTWAFRRAGFEVKYSEGFNPHMQLNLGTPLPLGINSCSEYLALAVDIDADEFLTRYNAVAPKGLEGLRAFNVPKNPNVAGLTVAADYSVAHSDAGAKKQEIEKIINMGEYIIKYIQKGEEVVKDVIPLLNGIRVENDKILLNLAAGNTTLRVDRLAHALAENFKITIGYSDIWKYEQYVRAGGVLLEMDEYLTVIDKKASDSI